MESYNLFDMVMWPSGETGGRELGFWLFVSKGVLSSRLLDTLSLSCFAPGFRRSAFVASMRG